MDKNRVVSVDWYVHGQEGYVRFTRTDGSHRIYRRHLGDRWVRQLARSLHGWPRRVVALHPNGWSVVLKSKSGG